MKYVYYNVNITKERVENDNLKLFCKKNAKDFTRNRKLIPKDLVLYTLNNRGKTTKMVIQ